MAIVTASDLSDYIQEAIRPAMDDLNQEPAYFWPGGVAHNYIQFVDRTADTGGVTRFGRYGELEAHDIVEGVDHNVNQGFDPDTSTISTSGHMTKVALTDILQRSMSPPNDYSDWAQRVTRAALRAHRDKFDAEVFEEAASLREGVSNTGAVLTQNDIILLLRKLTENSVPGPYIGFLAPLQYQNLLRESGSNFLDASASGERVAGDVWLNYHVVRFLGVNWFVTAKVYDNGTDVYGMVISGNRDTSPIGAVTRKMPVPPEVERDASALLTEIVFDSEWGTGIVDQHTGDDDATGYYIQSGNSATV